MEKNKIVPHLPPQSCSIKVYHALKQVKALILVLVVGLFAGAAASLAVVAWVAPTYDFYGNRADIFRGASKDQQSILSEDAETRIAASTVFAYRRGADSQQKFETKKGESVGAIKKNSVVGKGVFLSSDGWIVIPISVFQAAGGQGAEFFSKGKILSPVRFAGDPASGLEFIKVKGDGFPVMPIKNDFSWFHSDLYSGGNGQYIAGGATWKEIQSSQGQRNSQTIYGMPAVALTAPISGNSPAPGTPVAISTGELVGLIGPKDSNGMAIIYSFFQVQQILPSVFLAEKITRSIPAFKYVFVNEYNWLEKEPRLNPLNQGALVTAAPPPTPSSIPSSAAAPILPGDIILSIEGVSLKPGVDPAFLFSAFSGKTGGVRIKVLRAGNEEDLVV